jgi:hypothetical protein
MKSINSINGIPLHYARLTNHPYGTIGEQRYFSIDDDFLKILEKAFDEVFKRCPLGPPVAITTAGIFVAKSGQHGHGSAFDLDAIFWKDTTLVTLNFVHQKQLYLGIESILRKHFGIVLNHFYPNHADHWHLDTSVPVDYQESSKSETLYLQMALKYIYGKSVIIDGISGPQTRGFTREVFKRLKISEPITTIVNYLKFLDLTAEIAFKLSEDKVSPIELINNLEAIIDTLPTAQKQEVRQALNSFLDHIETSKWINSIKYDLDVESVIDDVLED